MSGTHAPQEPVTSNHRGRRRTLSGRVSCPRNSRPVSSSGGDHVWCQQKTWPLEVPVQGTARKRTLLAAAMAFRPSRAKPTQIFLLGWMCAYTEGRCEEVRALAVPRVQRRGTRREQVLQELWRSPAAGLTQTVDMPYSRTTVSAPSAGPASSQGGPRRAPPKHGPRVQHHTAGQDPPPNAAS